MHRRRDDLVGDEVLEEQRGRNGGEEEQCRGSRDEEHCVDDDALDGFGGDGAGGVLDDFLRVELAVIDQERG